MTNLVARPALVWFLSAPHHPHPVAVSCRKIEAVRESSWTADLLPDGITEGLRDKLRGSQQPGLAEFSQLIEIVRYTLSGSASSQTKANLLAFLEPLCTEDAIAEVLINTQLTHAITDCLGTLNSGLKTQAAPTLGLLVRHTRHIELAFVVPGAAQTPLHMASLEYALVSACKACY